MVKLFVYYENDVYKKLRFPFINDVEKQISYVKYEGILGSINLQNIDFDRLAEAVRSDIDSLQYEDIEYINKEYDNDYELIIGYTIDITKGDKVYPFSGSMRINLNKCFKNTLALINEELPKYSDNMRTEEDINGVYIIVTGNGEVDYYSDRKRAVAEYVDDTVENFNITDDTESKEIFKALKQMDYVDDSESDDTVRQIDMSFTKGGVSVYECYIVMPYNEIPPVVRKYLD